MHNKLFFIQFLSKILGVRDFDLPKWLKDLIADEACTSKYGEDFCSNVVFLICGYDKAQLNEVNFPSYVKY